MECGLVVNGPHFTSSVLYLEGDHSKKAKWSLILLYFTPHCVLGGGGVLPYKTDEGARWKSLRTYLLLEYYLNIFWEGVSQIRFHPRGTNSTTTNYITGTANFNTVKPVLSGHPRGML